MSCWHKARDDVSVMAWVLPKDLPGPRGLESFQHRARGSYKGPEGWNVWRTYG
jgi:hypothetical protein